MPRFDPWRQFGPNDLQLPQQRSMGDPNIHAVADPDYKPPMPPEKHLPHEDKQWFWEWESRTRKDPGYEPMWRDHFLAATGVDPQEIGAKTAWDALQWQASRGQLKSFEGVPESKNVDTTKQTYGPVETFARRSRMYGNQYTKDLGWWADTARYYRAGRLRHNSETGYEGVDPYDREMTEHMRRGADMK